MEQQEFYHEDEIDILGGRCDNLPQATTYVNGEIEVMWYCDKAMDLLDDFGPYQEALENDHVLEITTKGEITLIEKETCHHRRTLLHRHKTPYEQPTCIGCQETIEQGQERIKCPKCKGTIHQKCGGLIYANKGGLCLYCNQHPIFEVPPQSQLQVLQREIDLLRRELNEQQEEEVTVITRREFNRRNNSPYVPQESAEPSRSPHREESEDLGPDQTPTPDLANDLAPGPNPEISSPGGYTARPAVRLNSLIRTRVTQTQNSLMDKIMRAVESAYSGNIHLTYPDGPRPSSGVAEILFQAQLNESRALDLMAKSLLMYRNVGDYLARRKGEYSATGLSERSAERKANKELFEEYETAERQLTDTQRGDILRKVKRCYLVFRSLPEGILLEVQDITPRMIRQLTQGECETLYNQINELF